MRPLWPALGIIGVGILVALFIIIGHFYDKAIEKYQNEPSNPSTFSVLLYNVVYITLTYTKVAGLGEIFVHAAKKIHVYGS